MKNLSTDVLKSGKSADTGLYRAFANLAADWIWELDADLRYVFHDGGRDSVTGAPGSALVGRSRIDVLNEYFSPSEQLEEHHQLMLDQQRLDMVLPVKPEGPIKFVQVIAEPQFDEAGTFIGYRGCGRDVTRRVELEEKLEHLATHDDLTGAINRREFERKLNELHLLTKETNAKFSLCFIDLDKFKNVNDTGGHHAGDQLLRELVGVIRRHIQPGETLARLGGDEFGLLLLSDTKEASKEAEKIIDEISRYKFVWENKQFRVGASIGITSINRDSESVETLMIKADNACYAAKNNGRNQSQISDEQAYVETGSASHVGVIREAMQNNQYKLLMQPIASLHKEESFERYELLVRLACDDGELLEPAAFMPLARKYALMQELDCWVVENALLALSSLQASGSDVGLSINLCANTLADADALQRIISIFNRYPIPRNRVCFDITESFAIRNIDAVSAFMSSLKTKGVEFALDDFGNGLCSFTYLQHFPIDYLKIDGELIRKLVSDETVRCITSSFHDLAKKLGIKTVAESVEDAATVARIKEIGIDYMQGFGVADLVELETPTVLKPEFSIVK